ncbi:hypothetical protein [Peredibacter starrii]|uniref:Uncharacterized protein n=1 Tax=Peredibacter starrii TaxID=28202 RepID=A0AAX4HLL2_9BACT|nr:hypothetical protein [Peredibacter starrii]WPU63819.1 hypothetical protein SOO65_14080 [Peredibacter starrii]
MKYLIPLMLFSHTALAAFSKPELLARLSDVQAWNAPDNTWCFTSEPAILNDQVYLSCFDVDGYFMGQFGKGFKMISRAEPDNMNSLPQASFGKVTWYEFNEMDIVRSYEFTGALKKIELNTLGPRSESKDSFYPISGDSWFFRVKGDAPEIMIWKNGEVTPFFNPSAAYIYTPQVGPRGEIAFKTRDGDYNETSPDRLWQYTGSWKVILEDKEANPSSPWKTIRHQLAVEGNRVVALADDGKGEALLLIENGNVRVLARAGKELSRFDYFTPKMRGGTIAVRGEDFQKRKVLYVYDEQGFRPLLTQGDIVHTDKGPARVHYKDQNALFYGSPGIDERGSVVQQATLTDPDFPSTLIGIGIIKFRKE